MANIRVDGPTEQWLLDTDVYREFLAALNDEIDGIVATVAAGLGSVVTAAADDAGVSPDDANGIPTLWMAAVDGRLLAFLVQAWQHGYGQQAAWLLSALGRGFVPPGSPPGTPPLGAPEDWERLINTQQAAEDFAALARNRLSGVGDTLWDEARSQIVEGLEAGDSIDHIAKRLRDTLNVDGRHAEVIARTETVGASNAGSIEAMRQSGLVVQKDWIDTSDDRTRETHRAAAGQVVGLDELFEVGDAFLDYPGDPNGPPEEIIQCRCTLGYVVDEDVVPAEEPTDDEDGVVVADAGEHTGAMIALIPTEDAIARLALDGGEPAGELHVTLAFLGEAADWSPEQQAELVEEIGNHVPDQAVTGDAFGVNRWNPTSEDPAWVYAIGGAGLDDVHAQVWDALAEMSTPTIPDNHVPWVPHLTAAYTPETWPMDAMLGRLGPLMFDRIRVAFGGETTDIPLGGGTVTADAHQQEAVMPYTVTDENPECGGAAPWAVVKDDSGEVMGCHATREDAEAQLAALNIAEADDTDAAVTAAVGSTVPWSGVLAVEGVATGDGREFAPGSLTWPDPATTTIPLRWQKEDAHGGMLMNGVVTVGRIDSISREGNRILGTGIIDLSTPDGPEVARRMGTLEEPGILSGVSIDADDPDRGEVEFVWPEDTDVSDDEDVEDDLGFLFAEPDKVIFHSGRIRAATMVDIPAFVDAALHLEASFDAAVDNGTDDEAVVVVAGGQEDDVDELTVADYVEAIVASAHTITIPDLPPAAWFEEPDDVPVIGAFTVTDEGRIYGYVAPRSVAHRGRPDKRLTVPKGNVDYSRFMTRQTIIEGGRRLATGPITMNCGHAAPVPWIGAQAAGDHYDNSCAVVATVRVGENRNGTWMAGALLPDVTPSQVSRMLACQLSGDWRPHRERPGKREFVAALLVPVPGYPMETPEASLRAEDGVLVASAVPVLRAAPAVDREVSPAGRLVSSLARSIGAGRAARAARLAESIRGA